MAILRFVIFKQPNFIRFNHENIRAEANKLMVFRDEFEVLTAGEIVEIRSTMQELLDACDSLSEYLPDHRSGYERNSFRIVNFPESAQKTLDFALQSDKCIVVPYLVYYCLSRDWNYYSEMFSSIINEGGELIGFMKEYAFNPWPVDRYADMLGISMRKFNFIFKERFGITPKRWLMETRLIHARYLLTHSMMPVAEVANRCGFSNHAYFSESFRKRFSCSPSTWRNKYLLNINSFAYGENNEH